VGLFKKREIKINAKNDNFVLAAA